MSTDQRFWVNTISLEHVRLGVAGGFTQADHGKDTRLRRLHTGDGIAFYSPRTAYPSGEPLQQFTALGYVDGDEPYQVRIRPDLEPWRLPVRFVEVRPAAAKPLVEELSFVTDPARWGLPFRRGLFEIGQGDFALIAQAMHSAPVSGTG